MNPMGRRLHGAGILPIAKTTGNMLVAKRSALVSSPGAWGVFGGSAEPGDHAPLDTARREFYEETGYVGPIELYPGPVVRQDRSIGVMFVGIVPAEFTPALNEEHDDFLWVSPAAIPLSARLHWPLHEFLTQKPEPGTLRGRALLDSLRRANALF